jgi:hypothetical protein
LELETNLSEFDARSSVLRKHLPTSGGQSLARRDRKFSSKNTLQASSSNTDRGTLVLIPLEGLQGKVREFEAIIKISSLQLKDELLNPSHHPETLIGLYLVQ